METISMVLLAGGIGNRMKRSIPKQHLLLCGKPIIMHTLERIDNVESIGEVIITCPSEFIKETENIINQYHLSKPFRCIEGGRTRQESVYFGLKEVKTKYVLIHEAARPFVTRQEFENIATCEHENCIYGLDIPFTVLEGKEYIERNLDRERLINVQLPQKFHTAKLLAAHEKAIADNRRFTEDASLYFEYTSEEIVVLQGTEYNIKITKPIDLRIGETIYKEYILGVE